LSEAGAEALGLTPPGRLHRRIRSPGPSILLRAAAEASPTACSFVLRAESGLIRRQHRPGIQSSCTRSKAPSRGAGSLRGSGRCARPEPVASAPASRAPWLGVVVGARSRSGSKGASLSPPSPALRPASGARARHPDRGPAHPASRVPPGISCPSHTARSRSCNSSSSAFGASSSAFYTTWRCHRTHGRRLVGPSRRRSRSILSYSGRVRPSRSDMPPSSRLSPRGPRRCRASPRGHSRPPALTGC